jgi:hypothetical protein
MHMPELVFEVIQEADGGYCAECLTENIFTQANTWDKLRANVVEATAAFFFESATASPTPRCPGPRSASARHTQFNSAKRGRAQGCAARCHHRHVVEHYSCGVDCLGRSISADCH